MARCHARSRNGCLAPLPRVTVRYSRANASTRRGPDLGRPERFNGGAVTTAFGPAFTAVA
jgi:hypothetical protein